MSRRVIWKGAISFGLVHIPVALHAATSEQGLDFDWLDKRSMDPVGYKRVNKRTGREVARENIVKGIAYEEGQYVVLSQEEIAAAYPKTTQTIEIEAFVAATDIPFVYLQRPYYIAPINKAAKVYALLREILHKSGKVGIAKVVIQTKQHLALLAPVGPALVLELLRWGDEVRSWDELDLPPAGSKAAGLTAKELQMAKQLVSEMSQRWQAEDFTDTFKEQILKLVEEKIKAGDTAAVSEVETASADTAGAKIYDLTEMLQRSLNKSPGKAAKPRSAKAPASKRTSAAKGKPSPKRSTA
ncbi:Ku protein [Collimonas fungivorans]|uniref:Non-homologous end joining protein Ku n=1 Tax=Collimonas fungivorans (strain Ter331) TaxID=1005048 RepID=G0A8U1_COLFT|nr:Ku protein [Collimonas fungivorans]AEK61804.1 Ku domain protein [Collimonas fungivorans Ter331]